MIETQITETVSQAELMERIMFLVHEDARLVQIGCTRVGDELQIDYSFDNRMKFFNFRLMIPAANPEIESITKIYWCAFTYENELKDLFGIKVKGLALDFGGSFYKRKEQAPFAKAPPVQVIKHKAPEA